MTAASKNRRAGDLIPASLKAQIARGKAMGHLALGWACVAGAFILFLFNAASVLNIFRPMSSSSQAFVMSSGDGHLVVGLLVVIVGGTILGLSRFQRVTFFSVMALFTGAVLALSAMGLRQGWAISESTVVVRPAEFWKRDTVFTVDKITTIRRGCHVSQSRGEVEYFPIVDLNYAASGQTGTSSITQPFNLRSTTASNASHFVDSLSDLRPGPNTRIERIGSAIFAEHELSPSEIGASANFNQCVRFFAGFLDTARTSKFRDIVGAP